MRLPSRFDDDIAGQQLTESNMALTEERAKASLLEEKVMELQAQLVKKVTTLRIRLGLNLGLLRGRGVLGEAWGGDVRVCCIEPPGHDSIVIAYQLVPCA
jgi:hypothetical protein